MLRGKSLIFHEPQCGEGKETPRKYGVSYKFTNIVTNMAVGQNLRYLFCRDYHLFKRLLRVTGGMGF